MSKKPTKEDWIKYLGEAGIDSADADYLASAKMNAQKTGIVEHEDEVMAMIEKHHPRIAQAKEVMRKEGYDLD